MDEPENPLQDEVDTLKATNSKLEKALNKATFKKPRTLRCYKCWRNFVESVGQVCVKCSDKPQGLGLLLAKSTIEREIKSRNGQERNTRFLSP